MAHIYNFNAGPAILPPSVLEKARNELLDYAGTGMSIMEMSHRDGVFDGIIKTAENNFRTLMGIPDDYAVLFLSGGASQQFAMVPLNLLLPGTSADYVDTGSWASKAIKEAKIVGKVNVIWNGKAKNYMVTPEPGELKFDPKAAYSHICTNETIGGVRFPEIPQSPSPLVADMSSDILSREVDVKRFGIIYAGMQKNLGPSGVAVVVLRKDLAERVPETVNLFFRYSTHLPEPSLYNTPNTWAVYIFKLITEWMLENGGAPAMQKRNEEKAALLYAALDSSPFWKPCAERRSRSIMNVTWRLASEDLESKFVKAAKAIGMVGLKGHRSVGGIRASLYNAFPREGVVALVDFMKDFEKKNG